MKLLTKACLAIAMVGAIALPSFAIDAAAVESRTKITTSATGYKNASDVKYVTSGKYIANWGARGEDCSFLSTYAEDFYTGSYVYETLSQKLGGSTQSNAPQSALYASLKTLMKDKHTHITSYNETKEQYRYTDCVKSDYSHISSFYSGRELTGNWDSAATWNREHTWPNSKGLGGSDENDIMMLRPTWVQENSSRGNTAYGKSGSYYDPGESTRGDCARITLYVYVRWGNVLNMWGTDGVMENMNVLLEWMEEDPVDTWEMGRNDAVQAITGTRNVFVDYPEYAWLLFGKDLPDDMSTPSGNADEGGNSNTDSSSSSNGGSATDSSSSSSGGSATDSNSSSDSTSSSDGSSSSDSSSSSNTTSSSDGDGESGSESECAHTYGAWHTILKPTETTDGERERFCSLCGQSQKERIPALNSSNGGSSSGSEADDECAHTYGAWHMTLKPTETTDGERERFCSLCGQSQKESIPFESEEARAKEGCAGSIAGTGVGITLMAAYVFVCKKQKNK